MVVSYETSLISSEVELMGLSYRYLCADKIHVGLGAYMYLEVRKSGA